VWFLIKINECTDSEDKGKKEDRFPELPTSESLSKFCTTFSIAAVACTLRSESGTAVKVCGGRASTDGLVGREIEGMNLKLTFRLVLVEFENNCLFVFTIIGCAAAGTIIPSGVRLFSGISRLL